MDVSDRFATTSSRSALLLALTCCPQHRDNATKHQKHLVNAFVGAPVYAMVDLRAALSRPCGANYAS